MPVLKIWCRKLPEVYQQKHLTRAVCFLGVFRTSNRLSITAWYHKLFFPGDKPQLAKGNVLDRKDCIHATLKGIDFICGQHNVLSLYWQSWPTLLLVFYLRMHLSTLINDSYRFFVKCGKMHTGIPVQWYFLQTCLISFNCCQSVTNHKKGKRHNF